MAPFAARQAAGVYPEIDLAALVRSRGVVLVTSGSGRYAGQCPFCCAADGILEIAPAEGVFRCAVCGVAGDAAGFLGRFDGLSRRHALEVLKAGTPAYRARCDRPRRRGTVPVLPAPVRAGAGDAELLAEVAAYYHERLLASPVTLARLETLGLGAPDLLARFLAPQEP